MHSTGRSWQLSTAVSPDRVERVTEHLISYNKSHSPAVEQRFRPGNLTPEPAHAFAVTADGVLIGGCVGKVERLWHWLTIDILWVDGAHRGEGIGVTLLRAVEEQALRLGCRWSDVSTFDFQAPDFYRRAGYVVYGVKEDYPPGHTNHLLRKQL